MLCIKVIITPLNSFHMFEHIISFHILHYRMILILSIEILLLLLLLLIHPEYVCGLGIFDLAVLLIGAEGFGVLGREGKLVVQVV